ncbi:MAG: hypothetical protein FWG40_10770 [Peptococcaceae bacterium]|nr:hypothetical protein [Peptococcaceae bacterium]
MKRLTTLSITVMMILAISCILAGCGAGGGGKTKNPVPTAEEVVKLIIEQKWDNLLDYVNVEDTTFLAGKDLEWYMPYSIYKSILDVDTFTKIKGELISETGTRARIKVSVTVDEERTESFEIPVERKSDDTWGMDINDFCVTNWTIKATGGNAELYVNGVKAETKYQDGKFGADNLFIKWIIPAVGKNTAKVELKASTFGTYTIEETPTSNTGNEKSFLDMVVIGDSSAEDAIYKAIQKLWNDSYNDFAAGKSSADCLSYIGGDDAPEMAGKLWGYYEQISKGVFNKNKSFSVTDIGGTTKSNAVNVTFLTDEIIQVNFGYKLEWVAEGGVILGGGAKQMTRLSSVYLKQEGAQYSFWRFSDGHLFSQCTEGMNEWKKSEPDQAARGQ